MQTSDYLTVGTPDAPGNGNPAESVGRLSLKAGGENPINPNNGDQADVNVTASLTDLRNQGDFTDYTDELRVVLGLRITDRYNGAALDKPATVTTTPFGFDITCSSTAGSEGADCNVTTRSTR